MILGPATQSPESGRSGWRAVFRDPVVAPVALYALVAIGAAVAAYLTIFTEFAPYDDEGTLLVTLKAFAHGDVLYRDIYSPYGPFYYELFGGLFALSGKAVTTDASRLIVVVLWVGTSFLYGLAAHRLTGRLMLGVTGMIAAFGALYVLANEPMHPQVLCVLMLGVFTVLAVFGPTRRPVWLGAAGGALIAALSLTKLNLGAYAIVALVLAAVLTVEPLRRRRWVLWPVIAAAVALPIFVASQDLGASWVRNLVALEILAMAAIVVAAWPLGSTRTGKDALRRWLLGAAVGFVLAFVAIMVAIVLNGSSPADVYGGMVTEAMRIREVNPAEFPMPSAAVDWAIVAVAAAALSVRLRSGGGGAPPIWPGLLRAAAGLTIWFTVARNAPFALNPSAGNPDSLPAVLAWVAAIPPTGIDETPYKRFLRVLLPALAVAETFQVYPVAGSQMGIAALTFVPVGALCLGDALTCLRAWSAAGGARTLERFGAVTGVVTVALATVFALDSIARPAASNAVLYRHQPALSLPGASLLHLQQPEVEAYEGIVQLLLRHRCTTFIGYPSVDSLYLWSSIEAPSPTAPGPWIRSLDAKRQQRIVDEMRASPRPCAIRSDTRAEGWLHGAPAPPRPLVRYILDDFTPVAQAGDFQFLLPKARVPSDDRQAASRGGAQQERPRAGSRRG